MDLLGPFGLSLDHRSQKASIMYHGTTLRNALSIICIGFIPSTRGMLGPGIYVTHSFQKAATYPKRLPPGEEQAILRLRVRVGKVIRIDYQGHPLQKSWHQKGYDTAWVPPNCRMAPSVQEENCLWDPKRIEVLGVLNSDGTTKNLSSAGLMSGPFGYPCPQPVPPMLYYPCQPSAHPMPGFPCPTLGPAMLGCPCFPPGFPAPAYRFPYPGPIPPFWLPQPSVLSNPRLGKLTIYYSSPIPLPCGLPS